MDSQLPPEILEEIFLRINPGELNRFLNAALVSMNDSSKSAYMRTHSLLSCLSAKILEKIILYTDSCDVKNLILSHRRVATWFREKTNRKKYTQFHLVNVPFNFSRSFVVEDYFVLGCKRHGVHTIRNHLNGRILETMPYKYGKKTRKERVL